MSANYTNLSCEQGKIFIGGEFVKDVRAVVHNRGTDIYIPFPSSDLRDRYASSSDKREVRQFLSSALLSWVNDDSVLGAIVYCVKEALRVVGEHTK